MKIVSLQVGSEHRIGIELEVGIFDYSAAFQAYEREVTGREWRMIRDIETLLRFARFDNHSFDAVLQWVTLEGRFESFLVSRPRLAAPIRQPGKIIAMARNYVEHARETGAEPPTEPIFFVKSASTIIGPGHSIEIPAGVGRVDPEVELAVIIGESVRNCPRDKALQAIAGYTIINDVTARDMQKTAKKAGQPWYLSKNLETFCPMGPCVLLADESIDPDLLDIYLYVNGELRQHENTAAMIFDVATIISRVSCYMRLEPGDIIATGTPAGIGPIFPGDLVKCHIPEIGELVNPVKAAG